MKKDLTYSFTLNEDDKNMNNGHQSLVIWFFGLSGSGKSTLANSLEIELFNKNIVTSILDGDTLRNGLNNDLKFSKEDRNENLRRVAEVSLLLKNNGIVSICAFISPFESQRENISKIIGKKNILWIYVKTPLDICIKRDPKGLYNKAISGSIKEFTGVSHPFEEPKNCDYVTNYNNSINQEIQNLSTFVLKRIKS